MNIAWELAEAVRLKGSKGVVVAGAIQLLFGKGRGIRDQLSLELRRLDLNADEVLKHVTVPFAYADDFCNLIFAWRMRHWHPRTSENAKSQ